MIKLTDSKEWKNLQAHQRSLAQLPMSLWFGEDQQRFKHFSTSAVNIFLDYSKNRIIPPTMDLLFKLAQACQLEQRIIDLLSGGVVNKSEHRPALHSALRNLQNSPIYVDNQDVMPAIRATLEKINQMAQAIAQRQLLGFSGQPIDTIVHFGIGGSDLGPVTAFEALGAYVNNSLQYHFFSFQDPEYVRQQLETLNPATTLLIIASKSFTTSETLANANVAKKWLLTASPTPEAAGQQMVAVTAKTERAVAFGIEAQRVLPIWDWVGGRYSVWSAMSLIVAIAIGPELFRQFLAGAEAMDQHFRQTEFKANIPVILGLLDVWYNNFYGRSSRAIIPYGRVLRNFPHHLQQVFMESLGKQIDENGCILDVATGFVIWGGAGTNSQHSFHQLLLQGNQWVPIDFILPTDNIPLVAHCLAQSQVLMSGYREASKPEQEIPGNCPSHTLLLDKVTPYSLGALMALYEHRVYVNSVIWGINAFDQWGVERGKIMAQQIFTNLNESKPTLHYDSSTNGLITTINKRGSQ